MENMMSPAYVGSHIEKISQTKHFRVWVQKIVNKVKLKAVVF